MRFASAYMFFIALAVPAVLYLHLYHRRRASLRFSSTRNAAQVRKSLRQRLIRLPLVLRAIAMLLIVVALARPQQGRERVRDVSKGVAIEMVVDRSGSMQAEMDFGGQHMTRLEVVKRVFEEFVSGNDDDLPGRPNDLVGMITFARYADTVCPLTLAHGALSRFLEKVTLVTRRSEDGTAIGDAVALAAARLKTAEESLAKQTGRDDDSYQIKSKIIILLTDGENNFGQYKPEQAAKLAAEWGIKIYAIGVGGESIVTINTFFGPQKMRRGPSVDTSALKRMAQTTGGQFRLAEDADSLRAIYKEIDELEKSEIESIRYMDYRELFVPFALAAVLVLALEVLLSCTLFRRIP